MKYETEINFSFNNTMTIMIDEIKPNSIVLEFGPANGRLTKYLKEEKNCKVYIVEIDEEAGKIASEYAEDYVIGDIEQYSWITKFENVMFDYILFADVLEHLRHPEEVIVKSRDVLNENGSIITSLPNIAHNSVIIDLIKGKFEYKKTGLLDNTHIKFWTYENIENFFADAMLYVDKRLATYTQVGFNEFENSYSELEDPFLLKSREMGEVYQFVYVTKKSENVRNIDEIVRYSDYYYNQGFELVNDKIVSEIKNIITFEKNNICESFEISENVEKFRFDPLNVDTLIKINKITIDEKPISDFVVINGRKINKYVCFYNNDGQIIVNNEDNCKHTFYIEYELFLTERYSSSNLEYLLEELFSDNKEKMDIIEQKENYIFEQRDWLSQRENDICEQRDWLSQRDKEIAELKNKVAVLENVVNKSLISKALLLRKRKKGEYN